MKIQLLVIAGLFALASGLPAESSCDELKAQLSRRLQAQAENSQARLQAPALSVRSCDGDGDGELTALEFAGCLQRLTGAEREHGPDDLTSKRAACFQSFMAEADEDVDNAVSSAEFRRWSLRLNARLPLSSRNIIIGIINSLFRCSSFCLSDRHCRSGQECTRFRCCSVNDDDDDDDDNDNDGDDVDDGNDDNNDDGDNNEDSDDNEDGVDNSTGTDLMFGIMVERRRKLD